MEKRGRQLHKVQLMKFIVSNVHIGRKDRTDGGSRGICTLLKGVQEDLKGPILKTESDYPAGPHGLELGSLPSPHLRGRLITINHLLQQKALLQLFYQVRARVTVTGNSDGLDFPL